MEIKRFKLENIKKEYYLPLSIIISAIIIGIAIYLGTTAEFRHKKATCLHMYENKIKDLNSQMKAIILHDCMMNTN